MQPQRFVVLKGEQKPEKKRLNYLALVLNIPMTDHTHPMKCTTMYIRACACVRARVRDVRDCV